MVVVMVVVMVIVVAVGKERVEKEREVLSSSCFSSLPFLEAGFFFVF